MPKAVIPDSIKSEIIGENTVHLTKIKKGFSVSIITKGRIMAKHWLIASPAVNNEKVSDLWYGYVVNELKQARKFGITAIPNTVKDISSNQVNYRVQTILNRL